MRSLFDIETPAEHKRRMRREHENWLVSMSLNYGIVPPRNKKKLKDLYEVIRKLNQEYDVVSLEMVKDEAKAKHITNVDYLIKMLKVRGDVYSPKHHQYVATQNR